MKTHFLMRTSDEKVSLIHLIYFNKNKQNIIEALRISFRVLAT